MLFQQLKLTRQVAVMFSSYEFKMLNGARPTRNSLDSNCNLWRCSIQKKCGLMKLDYYWSLRKGLVDIASNISMKNISKSVQVCILVNKLTVRLENLSSAAIKWHGRVYNIAKPKSVIQNKNMATLGTPYGFQVTKPSVGGWNITPTDVYGYLNLLSISTVCQV